MYTFLFIMSISTFFIQPIFIPLFVEHFNVEMSVAGIFFSAVIGLSGLTQYVFSKLATQSKKSIVIAFLLCPIPFLYLLDQSLQTLGWCIYGLFLAANVRAVASIVLEVEGKSDSYLKNSIVFYTISNIALIFSGILLILFVENIPQFLIYLDVATSLFFIIYSLWVLSTKSNLTQKLKSNTEKYQIHLPSFVGILILHFGCMAQFGLLPFILNAKTSEMLLPQSWFNLFQSVALVSTGFLLSKITQKLTQMKSLQFGVGLLVCASIFLSQISGDNNTVILLVLGAIWGVSIALIAPACSAISISKNGPFGTSLNILAVRVSMMIAGISVVFYKKLSFTDLQILSSIIPICGLGFILWSGPRQEYKSNA